MPKQYADFAEWAEEKMELEREVRQGLHTAHCLQWPFFPPC